MTLLGQVASLWRYPVKSMAGQECRELYFGFAGAFGDRCWALHDAAARRGMPYLTATAFETLLCYQPSFRCPERAALPPNHAEAASMAPGLTPANASAEELAVDVLAPTGERFALEDPRFLQHLAATLDPKHQLRLLHSDRSLTDCRPASLIGSTTIATLEAGLGRALDRRRFRMNVYAEWSAAEPEEGFVGRRIRLGERVTLYVLERDPRCKMISLDPETAAHDPSILRHVAQRHDACAGVYAAVLVEGVVRQGDPIALLD